MAFLEREDRIQIGEMIVTLEQAHKLFLRLYDAPPIDGAPRHQIWWDCIILTRKLSRDTRKLLHLDDEHGAAK